jgi:hypothetical protein
VVAVPGQSRQPQWTAAPGTTWTLDAITRSYPHLGRALSGILGAAATVFADVLQMIDESLWGIVPGGLPDDQAAAVLAGRPLALVRARAALELNGPALSDPTWPLTFSPQAPAVLGYDFPVRIGDTNRRGDGLVGYYNVPTGGTETSYVQVNVARMPGGVQPGFLRPIGPGNFVTLRPNGAPAYLTMLVDPRAPVHAISDIVPVSTLSIPRTFVDAPIGTMQLYFDISPMLTELLPAAIALPVPATRSFTWTWREPGTTAAITVVPPAPGAAMPVSAAQIRYGWLCLNYKPE